MSDESGIVGASVKRTSKEQVAAILEQVSPEARQLVGEVLRLEQAQIHKKQATGVANDIVDITEKIVK